MTDDADDFFTPQGIEAYADKVITANLARQGLVRHADEPAVQRRLAKRQADTIAETAAARRRSRKPSPAEKASRAALERHLETEAIISYADDPHSRRLAEARRQLGVSPMTTEPKNPFRESESAEEYRDRQEAGLKVAEAYAHKLYQDGAITAQEARAIGRLIMKEASKNASVEDWVALRESAAWPAYENALRQTPDGLDWQATNKAEETASRKLMARIFAEAWMNGAIGDDVALAKLKEVARIEDADATGPWTADEATLINAGTNIVAPDKHYKNTVSYEKPLPQRLPEEIGDNDLKYSDRDSRTNSPSARERRRVTEFIDDVHAHGEAAFPRNSKMAEHQQRLAMGIIERRKSQPMPATGKVMNKHEAEAAEQSANLGNILRQGLDGATHGVLVPAAPAPADGGGSDAGGGGDGQPS
jgi:hypothetical protein